jgi:hypothetical protein
VKNNLQTMASMVRIVARKGTPDSQPAFQDIARRIATLGHAYDHIHKAEDMARLDLGVYLKSITQQIANSFGRDEIRVTTVMDSLPVDIDTALPVGRLGYHGVALVLEHLPQAEPRDRLVFGDYDPRISQTVPPQPVSAGRSHVQDAHYRRVASISTASIS